MALAMVRRPAVVLVYWGVGLLLLLLRLVGVVVV
jgi:hypothetical protein